MFNRVSDAEVQSSLKTIMRMMQTISDELTYDTLHASEDNLRSALLMTGYITKADPDEEGETVSLKIPNKEIASIFEDTVVVHFRNTANASELSRIYKDFLLRDRIFPETG